ncbi:MAG: universal stress protein [Arenicellales bacterium]
MSLADILVHIDGSDKCVHRMKAAHALVESFDVHITGVHAYQLYSYPTHYEVAIPPYVVEQAEAQAKEESIAARAVFDRFSQSWESKFTWISDEGDPATVISKYAGCHDLVVVSQFDPQAREAYSRELPDRIAFESGRPVLVIPNSGPKETIGQSVLVAWDGSREASRAIHDALPFLNKASKVDIVSVTTAKEVDLPSADIASHLSRHGISVETQQTDAKGTDVGTVLTSLASESGADLIVMGAYGHSRFRELILGGVTRHVLESMPVPVLMTH